MVPSRCYTAFTSLGQSVMAARLLFWHLSPLRPLGAIIGSNPTQLLRRDFIECLARYFSGICARLSAQVDSHRLLPAMCHVNGIQSPDLRGNRRVGFGRGNLPVWRQTRHVELKPGGMTSELPSSARNRGKSRMERPSSRKPTLGMSGSASVWFISERVGSDRLRCVFSVLRSSEILHLPRIFGQADLRYGQ